MKKFEMSGRGEEEAVAGKRSASGLRSGAAYLATLAAIVLASSAARAEAPRQIDVELMVSRISKQEGSIDSRAGRLHRKLSREFSYKSLEVIESRRVRLAIDEVGGLALPDGRKLRVKPLLVDDRGVLLAVDLEGRLQTDMRVKNGQLVIIGADRHEKGKLVISLEAHF